ncbi:MAG TPA: AsmA family protein, partial [Thermoanaerobaculia bacterium]
MISCSPLSGTVLAATRFMSKGARRLLIGLGIFFGIIVLAVAVLIVVVDEDDLKRYASTTVTKATGREFVIEGDLDIDLGWVSRVRAEEIQFENASWSDRRRMFEADALDVEIDLWQILRGRLVLPTVTLSAPRVILEKNKDGAANWDFRASEAVTEPVAAEDRTEFPVIQKLLIEDGSLLF